MSERLRQIKPLQFPRSGPSPVAAPKVEFRWVDPASLFVEEMYQRSLSKRSISMVGRIVASWDWCAIKPPICAIAKNGELVVIDGQHTAIAAASHGAIPQIPIMIVDARDAKVRANAFLRHNTERTQITHVQKHHAAVAAGESVAEAVAAACIKTGVTIRRSNPSCGVWGKNETVAVVALRRIAEQKGVAGLTRVLRILVKAYRSPIAALELNALYAVLYGDAAKPPTDAALTTAIMKRSVDEWGRWAQKESRKAKVPAYKVLAAKWSA